MKYIGMVLCLFMLAFSLPVASEEQQFTQDEQEYLAWAQKIWDSLDRQQGDITLPNDVASLKVPENFYYLSPKDAETVLVEVWENPPGSGTDTLGMLFPSAATPFDEDSWGVMIQYEEDGYVSDENAEEIDFDELLTLMKEDTQEESKERVSQGYEPVELVGWAAKPYYDKGTHKLYWAKEVKFGDQDINTLNYNIRILGRKGVLVLNFIAGMDQKQTIDSNIDSVLALADFNQGSRYEDFDPSVDQVAAYGIGALVAGKVLAKTGLFAAALIFLKKFGVFILIGAGTLLGKLFRRKTS
jgi:uncharacterized membrane-anchored protein